MFSIVGPESFSLFLTIISYIGFFASGCMGFNLLTVNEFEINLFMISLSTFIFSILFLLLELVYYLKYDFIRNIQNIYYIRFLVLIVFGILIIGTSDVGLVFGLIGFVSSLVNLFIGIFTGDENEEETY